MTMLELLLQRGGVDTLNATDRDGNTAFHLAYRCDEPDCMAMLVQAGCDMEIKNGDGLTVTAAAGGRLRPPHEHCRQLEPHKDRSYDKQMQSVPPAMAAAADTAADLSFNASCLTGKLATTGWKEILSTTCRMA